MTAESSKAAWPKWFGWLIFMVSTFVTEAAAAAHSAQGAGVWMSVTPAAGPVVCLSPNGLGLAASFYARSVGVASRPFAYSAFPPFPRRPFGAQVFPRYLEVQPQAAVMRPSEVRLPRVRMPPALLGMGLVRGPVPQEIGRCTVH